MMRPAHRTQRHGARPLALGADRCVNDADSVTRRLARDATARLEAAPAVLFGGAGDDLPDDDFALFGSPPVTGGAFAPYTLTTRAMRALNLWRP